MLIKGKKEEVCGELHYTINHWDKKKYNLEAHLLGRKTLLFANDINAFLKTLKIIP